MKTKQCTKCNSEKSLDDFNLKNKKTGSLEAICKICKRAYVRSHYRANKEVYKKRAKEFTKKTRDENSRKMVEYLRENPCVDCGEPDVVVLQFDHIQDKEKHIGQMIAGGYSWPKVLDEINKCQVRCANCHTRKTAKDFKWKWKV